MLLIYPTITHLMCYFHVIKSCKDHLKSCRKEVQSKIMSDINYLHSSMSEEEFQLRYQDTMCNWCNSEPQFATYFDSQWNPNDSFNKWKIFCSEPGVACTNNAIESFNKTFKKNYTFGTRHSLPALVDIIMEKLIFNLSMDIINGRKAYEVRRKPTSTVRRKCNAISDETYTIRKNEMLYYFTKRENNHQHTVDLGNVNCTCRFFMKHAYCKHLLHVYKICNADSDHIVIDRRFNFRGNTRITQRQRGRVADAAPALVRM